MKDLTVRDEDEILFRGEIKSAAQQLQNYCLDTTDNALSIQHCSGEGNRQYFELTRDGPGSKVCFMISFKQNDVFSQKYLNSKMTFLQKNSEFSADF